MLTDSVEMPELDGCFYKADAVLSSVSLGFLHLFSTAYGNSRLQHAPSINSYTVVPGKSFTFVCASSTLNVNFYIDS